MKVILSVEPIRYPLTGIGRYTLELARHLKALPEIEALRYFAGTDFVPALPQASEAAPSLRSSPLTEIKRRLARLPVLVDHYRTRIDGARRRSLAAHADHVYHGPNFYLPPVAGPAVVTIHDLSIVKYPRFHPPERVGYMEKEIAASLTRATRIVTDSDFVRDEIAEHFGFPIERIHTTCLAGSGAFRPRGPAELQIALARFELIAGHYTLFAGTIEPRKNLERLLAAFERLPPGLRRGAPLVLVGYKGWNNDAIMARIRRAETEGWARYLGYVPDAALPALFGGARLFVFPSLYEGFGLPVLEAMASGVPVVTSNAASLPQVAGDAAALVDPEDTDALKQAMVRALEDDAWRDRAIAAGLAQAARFSWQRCAEETADVYRHAWADHA